MMVAALSSFESRARETFALSNEDEVRYGHLREVIPARHMTRQVVQAGQLSQVSLRLDLLGRALDQGLSLDLVRGILRGNQLDLGALNDLLASVDSAGRAQQVNGWFEAALAKRRDNRLPGRRYPLQRVLYALEVSAYDRCLDLQRGRRPVVACTD